MKGQPYILEILTMYSIDILGVFCIVSLVTLYDFFIGGFVNCVGGFANGCQAASNKCFAETLRVF